MSAPSPESDPFGGLLIGRPGKTGFDDPTQKEVLMSSVSKFSELAVAREEALLVSWWENLDQRTGGLSGERLERRAFDRLARPILHRLADSPDPGDADGGFRFHLDGLANLMEGLDAHQDERRLPASAIADCILSLKGAYRPFLRQIVADGGQRHEEETRRISTVIDELFPLAFEIHAQTRERLILQQSRSLVEMAESANRAKSLFLASVSHEIRTPINAILGMGQLLADSTLPPEEKEFVRISNTAGEALLALVNDILDLSKIEAGQLALEKIPFDLTQLVRDATAVLILQAQDKGIKLVSDLDPDTPSWVIGDPDRLRQILLNLLSNAVKFTAQGSVSLQVASAGPGHLSFKVTDTGIGIPKGKQDYIFQPFTQANSETARQYGGTGLGLTICQQLVEKMGGRMALESAVGRGSIFQFTIPLPKTERVLVSISEGGAGPCAYSERRPLTILLVDDAVENRMIVEAFLKQGRHHVESARDGAEGLLKFLAGTYDLVLMDIEMPVMDGYAAVRSIRAWETEHGRERTPIAAFTAHAMREYAEKILEAGCDLHITKPIRKASLLEVIDRIACAPGYATGRAQGRSP